MKKAISWLLCMTLLLLTTTSGTLAQSLAQLMPADSSQSLSRTPAQPKPDLRATFVGIKTQAKAGASLEANMKRLDTEWLNPKPQAGYTKKQKILVYSIVAGLIVLAVVLALTTKKGGHTFCSDDPTDPECLPG
jgi:hypothetical protein